MRAFCNGLSKHARSQEPRKRSHAASLADICVCACQREAQIRINCDDAGNFHKAQAEGLEHLERLKQIALKATEPMSSEIIQVKLAEKIA